MQSLIFKAVQELNETYGFRMPSIWAFRVGNSPEDPTVTKSIIRSKAEHRRVQTKLDKKFTETCNVVWRETIRVLPSMIHDSRSRFGRFLVVFNGQSESLMIKNHKIPRLTSMAPLIESELFQNQREQRKMRPIMSASQRDIKLWATWTLTWIWIRVNPKLPWVEIHIGPGWAREVHSSGPNICSVFNWLGF